VPGRGPVGGKKGVAEWQRQAGAGPMAVPAAGITAWLVWAGGDPT
jgi:hypothetical protein